VLRRDSDIDKTMSALKERAKELGCLYSIEDVLKDTTRPLNEIFQAVIEAIPPGWRYPEMCAALIVYDDVIYTSPQFVESQYADSASIVVSDETVGLISVLYNREVPVGDVGCFLNEEVKLLKTIAEMLGHYIEYRRIREVLHEKKTIAHDSRDGLREWEVILELIRHTDLNLFRQLTRKMIINLCWRGIPEARVLQKRLGVDQNAEQDMPSGQTNQPLRREVEDAVRLGDEVFAVAASHLSSGEILASIQKWIHEDKSGFLLRAVKNIETPVTDLMDALGRFQFLSAEGLELTPSIHQGIKVSLIRRFFTDNLDYINIAKEYVGIGDFYDLLQRTICAARSHGRLGGKSSGLFLAAGIIRKLARKYDLTLSIKTPRTWYVTSDGIVSFMRHNNLEEIQEQKYKEIGEVRREYDHIVQIFKSSTFPPEMVRGFSMALDDLEDRPIIVRSSSLLEDRVGSAFSGKYKSLFLSNQGSKAERLDALLDAVAEVYSSLFGPDPIEYRAERGLLDFDEEMGLMIQEVVGARVGKYWLPSYAGVAFSNNEFRWSPRIRREDGLIRLVPGLGTRAVDRLSDDFPVMLAPGQPGLRANVMLDEVIHYSPSKMDVINLEEKCFETVVAGPFVAEHGIDQPLFRNIISILRDEHLSRPTAFMSGISQNDIVITFDGLISQTPFLQQMHTLLRLLQDKLEFPVDIEFASDGKDLYLLQCRSQTRSDNTESIPLPRDVPTEDVVFSARRFVTNGYLPDITKVVYVDPQRYSDVSDLDTLMDIGRAVGQLNKLLPRRQFILMGPGRWGSRGDVKLGVSVTYSDINNTAMLVEIARKHGDYYPDVSFGTHFFQDLVESNIRYLPLYPDDPGVLFNEHFLLETANLLPTLLPEFAYLEEVLRVIDVQKSANGRILRVWMNADLDEAIGVLVKPDSAMEQSLQRRR
jgi:pyruvate,water dikinase